MTNRHNFERLLACAGNIGFDVVGFCRAESAATFPAFQNWLEAEMHGEMTYLHRHSEARRHPSSVLTDVKTIFVVGLGYENVNPPQMTYQTMSTISSNEDFGFVAEYARGHDYHDILRAKLQQLAETHRQLFPDARTRVVVDTAPILEREYTLRSRLAWLGKNTMLINDQCGSRFFLGLLLSTVEFCETSNGISCSFDSPEQNSFCGTCRRCVDACPTGALTPYQLDARKCLNYWSIEYQGDDIPPDIAAKFGRRLFGCETCQSVCPFNKPTARASEQKTDACPCCRPHEKFRPQTDSQQPPPRDLMPPIDPETMTLRQQLEGGCMSLAQIEMLDENTFQREFSGTPLLRLGLARLKRNAAIVRRNVSR